MSRRNLTICGIVLAALFAAVLFAGTGSAQAAAPPCSLVGTWQGLGQSGSVWLAIMTPGPNATTGQVDIQWVLEDPTLMGYFPDAVRITDARGVWQKIDAHNYKYTWMDYALDADGNTLYIRRVSGTGMLVDCDHTNENWVLEVFLPGQDMDSEPPIVCASGTASQERMKLVQATCDQP